MEIKYFHWADYLVFGVTLAVSSATGIFFGCTGKKQSTTEEYLMAGRNMQIIPVSVSMFVSWLSAISFLGDPVEVYYYGAQYWMLVVGYSLGTPPVAHFFTPKFIEMKLISVYEYLEERFSKQLRLLGSAVNMIALFVFMSVVLYAPAVALSQVTGLQVWISIITTGLVSTFYSTLGGMKAVLWADTIQMTVMLAGLMALVIQGCIRLGGITEVWNIADRGGRLNFNNFNPSPFIRNTFWTYLIGGFFRVFNPYISSQILVQRYCTVSTVKKAQMTLYLNVPLFLLFGTMFMLTGLVLYGMYHDCDPLTDGRILRKDQMVPLMVMDLLGYLPGVPGVFLACVFSASLSTLSSGQNAIAAQVLKDFVEPAWIKCSSRSVSEREAAVITRISGVVCGAGVIGLAFTILYIGGSVFQITITLTGVLLGPLAGIFFTAICFRFVNSLSVFLGFLVSCGVCIWFSLGSMLVPHGSTPPMNTTTAGCINSSSLTQNFSTFPPTTPSDIIWTSAEYTLSTPHEVSERFTVANLYQWSPMLYAPLGTLLTIFITLILSGISVLISRKFRRNSDTYKVTTAAPENPRFYTPDYDLAEKNGIHEDTFSKKTSNTDPTEKYIAENTTSM